MNILQLIGRENELFIEDISNHEKELSEVVSSSRFLVIGGAGSIGQAVTKEIFKRNPQKLHVVDISENNMEEQVIFLSGLPEKELAGLYQSAVLSVLKIFT